MQLLITFVAVVAGLLFSIAVALVVEELIFGQVFRSVLHPGHGKSQIRQQRQPSKLKN